MNTIDFNRMINRFLWATAFLIFSIGGLIAQNVSFSAKGPRVVRTGERFRLTYSINQQGAEFQPGEFNGFTLLSGPNMSTSSSVQIVNGQMTQSVEIQHNYILVADKEGKFTITPGKATFQGKSYTSNAVTIEVVKGNTNATTQGNSNRNGNNVDIPKESLFIRMLVSKKEVMKGEPIVATLKLYSRVGIRQLTDYTAPTFDGFWSETLKSPQEISQQRENVNGTIYQTAVIQQNVLIPERSGTLTIDPAELTAGVQVKSQRRGSGSVFDEFFGGRVQIVEKIIKSGAIKLNVKTLPGARPANFSGAIGDIKLDANLSENKVKANDAVTLTINYSGTGNLKLISPPALKLPPDLEVYDPKISNNYNASSKGFSGNKRF